MKKIITLSLVCTTLIFAQEVINTEKIEVIEELNSTLVNDVSHEQIKSADLAEALVKNVPSISLVRRSGIANDIILRGQKKDNINILIDDAKIYGACPNRMDPPTSHVLTNNIESVEVIEGPYDVENFGTLSGKVNVKTKEPKEGISGELNFGIGSFGYRKASATLSGGTEKVKFLLSTSTEKSDEYEDGDGNDFLEQQIASGVPSTNRYSKDDLEAYEKKTLLSKLIFNIDESSEVKLSYTANRSDNVLYPNTKMDAKYDDSDIYTIGYEKRDLGKYSKALNLDYYYSKVDHPMDTAFREAGSMMYMTNHMKSKMWGAKIKNSMEIEDYLFTYGIDTSKRNWKGNSYMTNVTTGAITMPAVTLYSTDTKNKAIFTKLEKSFGKLDVEVGSRYDYTEIENENSAKTNKKYVALSGNIFAVYNADENTKYFAGIGKSSRVPDARELYYGSTNNDLEDTKNYEIDLGIEKNIGNLNIKAKTFYSKLEDYIYNVGGTFDNIDAKIYGAEVSGFYMFNENFSLDYGVAYQRGKKTGNYTGDSDLAEIAPLKGNLALNYEYSNSKFTAEMIATDRWDSFDDDAKEQELAGWAIVNLKYNNQIHKNIGFTLGVDNVFDKTYASTNTYQDITYISTGGEQTLLNDPGRYFYANLKFSF